MSFVNKISAGVSHFVDNELTPLLNSAQQIWRKVTTPQTFGDQSRLSSTPWQQNNSALQALAMNVAPDKVPGMPLTPQALASDDQRRFQTIGGEWRRNTETGTVDFYRTGQVSDKTELFDQEYYLPDSQKYPLAANGKYVRLNSKGDLNSLPEYKDKLKPENVSNFDWQGYEWVDAAQVPAEHIAGEGKVSFENAKLADNQINALKRFAVDNNLVTTWDEAKFQEIFAAKAGTTIKLELEKTGEANGKTVFNAKLSGESLTEFRAALNKYRAETENDRQGGAQGQQDATDMAFDIPKVYARAAIKTGQDLLNTAAEIADPSIKTDPHNLTRARIGDIMDAQLPTPHNGARQTTLPRVDAEPVMPDYNSDLFNRDVLTGEVNKDGITVGKLTETAVELAAPTVASKVATPVKAPQSLDALEAFPNFRVKQGKWNYFFDRGVKPDAHNTPRALQNKTNLEQLGIFDDAKGKQKMLAIFDQGLSLPTKAKNITQYGTTITKHVKVSDVGGIDVKYFYPNGVMNAKPQISSMIPKIYQ